MIDGYSPNSPAVEPIYQQLAASSWGSVNERGFAYLATAGRRANGALRHVIRNGVLAAIPRPAWSEQAAALRTFYGCHDRHFFGVSGHVWLPLIETQVTGGLAHFLNAGGGAARIARITALFAACGVPLREANIVRAGAAPEHRLPGGHRLDLVAFACGRDGKDHLLVIEGKLDHSVGPQQLRRYELAVPMVAAAHHLETDAATILKLIGSRRRGDVDKTLLKAKRWTFVTWRDLMLRLERWLGEADDEEFRRFRKTLWERSA